MEFANALQAVDARRCGVISALSKQRRCGVPAAARAHELWRELQASGLADRDAAATTIGARAECPSAALTCTPYLYTSV